MFLWFHGVISCRIKPNEFFFFVFLVEFQLHFKGILKVYVTFFFQKLKKTYDMVFFCFFFMKPLILERKFSKPEMSLSQKYISLALISENFVMIEKHVLNLLDSQVDPKMWNLVSKSDFLCFWPPWKSVFEFMKNLKFSFSESGPESAHICPKPIFLFKFSNF